MSISFPASINKEKFKNMASFACEPRVHVQSLGTRLGMPKNLSYLMMYFKV